MKNGTKSFKCAEWGFEEFIQKWEKSRSFRVSYQFFGEKFRINVSFTDLKKEKRREKSLTQI